MYGEVEMDSTGYYIEVSQDNWDFIEREVKSRPGYSVSIQYGDDGLLDLILSRAGVQTIWVPTGAELLFTEKQVVVRNTDKSTFPAIKLP